jgi:hypothetical protein
MVSPPLISTLRSIARVAAGGDWSAGRAIFDVESGWQAVADRLEVEFQSVHRGTAKRDVD